jgi:hypothetical protein
MSGRWPRGLRSRWVDVYENQGKRSGAYHSGAYTTAPYILMNYQATLDSVFTLAHELGHAMHSYSSKAAQPYVYGYYTIFVAEVASTVNEALLTFHLLKQTDDRRLRMSIINRFLEQFRTTLYRQTMFAEFELLTHRQVEAGQALTPDWLNAEYKALNELLRRRSERRRPDQAGMGAHPPLLQRFLCLQIRHRPIGGGRPRAPDPGRRRAGRRPLSRLPPRRLLRLLDQPAPARRRRHDHPGASRAGAGDLRGICRRTGAAGRCSWERVVSDPRPSLPDGINLVDLRACRAICQPLAGFKQAFSANRPQVTVAGIGERLRLCWRRGGAARTWVAIAGDAPVGCASLVVADHADRPELTPG